MLGPWRLTALTLVLCASAAAQDIQAFKPAVGTWNYLSVNGAALSEVGSFTPSLYVNYGRNPLVHRDPDGNIIELVLEDLTTFDLLLAVGLHERVEVGLDVPLGYSGGEGNQTFENGSGLGDVRLVPKVRVLGDGSGFGVATVLPLSFPTGDLDGGSKRHFIATPHLVAEYRTERWAVAANGGYRWRPTNKKTLEPLTVGNGITYGGAAMYAFGDTGLQALVEAFGTKYLNDADNADELPTPLEGLAGFRLFSEFDLAFTLSGGIALVPDFSAPEFRVVSGIAWAPGADDGGGGGGATRGPALRLGDRDEDGIQDRMDACLDVPEDRDGFQDADGCPEADNDADGIADLDDRCPLRPEDPDGFEDEDGCPEVGPAVAVASAGPAVGAPQVAVDGDRLDVPERVFFHPGRAELQSESFPVLMDVARFLQRRADLGRVRVEGHTDTTGGAAFNADLAARRAEAVVLFMVSTGLDPERFDTTGVGPAQPVGDNTTRQGRALNRRVEFKLVDAAPAAEQADAAETPVVEPEVAVVEPEVAVVEPEVAVSEVAAVESVAVTGDAAALSVELGLSGAPGAEVTATLSAYGDLLTVKLPGVEADRQRPKPDHRGVRGVLVHRRDDATFVKVRLERGVDPARAAEISTVVEGALVRVTLPLSAPQPATDADADADVVGAVQ